MLGIEIIREGSGLTLRLSGDLDTNTSKELQAALEGELSGVSRLVLDFKEIEYISSAGLRVLLSLQRTMDKQGEMVIRNVAEKIRQILDITGFSVFLKIE